MTKNTFYANLPTYGRAVAITALRPNAPEVNHKTSETTSATPIYAKILYQPDLPTNQIQRPASRTIELTGQLDQSRKTPLTSSPESQIVNRAIERRTPNYDRMCISPHRMQFSRYGNITRSVSDYTQRTDIGTQTDLSIGVKGVVVVHWEYTQTCDSR